MLKMYEYDVHLKPMPLGYAGTIYNCNLSMLKDLDCKEQWLKEYCRN
jgi:hypothetical protein